jgi:hypothetical protein
MSKNIWRPIRRGYRRARIAISSSISASSRAVQGAVFSRPFASWKLPGWASIVLGFVTRIAEHEERIRHAYHIMHELGGEPEMIAAVVESPWFSATLVIGGVGYLVFVGEPKKGVQRQPWWPIIGWSVFGICLLGTVSVIAYGSVYYLGAKLADQKIQSVQRQALSGQLLWRMTDFDKYMLGRALDAVPEGERFDFKIWCSQDTNSKTYTEDFAQVLVDHKWKPNINCLFNNLKSGIFGLWITAKGKAGDPVDLNKMPPQVRKMADIFQAAQIPFVWGANDQLTENDYYLAIGIGPAK